MVRADNLLKVLGFSPKPQDPNSVLRAMVATYLVDWKAAVDLGCQISDASWKKSGALPMAKEVLYGLFAHRRPSPYAEHLSDRELAVIHSIKEKSERMDLDQMVRLAGSTYPMIAEEQGDVLDLAILAEKYKKDFARKRERAPV